MTIEEMFEKLWWSYPNDLCKGKKGGKQPALKALKKINPDEKEFKRIMLSLEAMKKAVRKDPDAYRWAFVSSWLNQARYDDAMPDMQTVEPLKKTKLNICKNNGCSDTVHSNKEHLSSDFEYCAKHIPSPKWDKRLRDAWKETGLDMNSPTLVADCREHITKLGYGSFIK